MQDFFDITVNLARILGAVAFVLGLIRFKRLTKAEKWYVFYLFVVFCIEYISYGLDWFSKDGNNTFLYPFYIAGEFFTITGVFIKKLNLNRSYFILTGVISLFFLSADQFLSSDFYKNDYSKGISNLVIISLAGYTLLQEIKKGIAKDRFSAVDKMIFLYFTVSIFIFIFQHQLMEFPIAYFTAFWSVNNILCCLFYSLFIKTFLTLKK